MTTNVSQLVLRHASSVPDRMALTIPREWTDAGVTRVEAITYGELAERVGQIRAGLADEGLVEGDRVVVMFPVSVDLYALVLALFASGMVAVFVDTGMPRTRIFEAISRSDARAVVSVDPLLKLWPILRVLWRRKRYSVDRRRIGVRSFGRLVAPETTDAPVLDRGRDSSALMTFTSGSTGAPKAANRTHDILIAQHRALLEEFPNEPGEIDMTCFPVVPLHNLCCGTSTVMPAVDLSAPASVVPSLILEQVAEYDVTRLSGAPAFLERIADELERRGGGLQTVTRIACGGAPTPRDLCRRLADLQPDTELSIIYGSTEAEPMAMASMRAFLAAEGDGYLVGEVSEAAEVVLVDLPSPVPTLDEREMEPFRVERGEPGEVVVRGAHVLREYVAAPAADRESKISSPGGGVWHRTGDVAYRDEEGRLWLLGRLEDAIPLPDAYADPGADTVLHPYPLESVIQDVDGVARCAVIAHEQRPHGEVVVELSDDAEESDVTTEIARLVAESGFSHLADESIGVVPDIPMDSRHNSKVVRPELRERRSAELGKVL